MDYTLPASDPLFKRLGILKIHEIFELNVATFIFKTVNKIHPTNFNNWFILVSEIHGYSTRGSSSRNLYIPHVRTTHYGLKAMKYIGPQIWNNLPIMLKAEKNLNLFISNLKKYLNS